MSEGEAVIGKTSLEQLPTWKTAPTRPYRVSICRINEKLQMGCVATDWGRFDRIDLHLVESISLLRQVFFLSRVVKSEEAKKV